MWEGGSVPPRMEPYFYVYICREESKCYQEGFLLLDLPLSLPSENPNLLTHLVSSSSESIVNKRKLESLPLCDLPGLQVCGSMLLRDLLG